MDRHFKITSETAHLEGLRKDLREFLKQTGIPNEEQEKVLIALGEACTNSIRHSYHYEPGHAVEVAAQDSPDRIVFRIRDYGTKINLAAIPKPELPPQKGGGLGIYFMQTIMDEFEYNTAHEEGNELILVKYKGKH